MNEIPKTDNELIKNGFPPGIHIITIDEGPPKYPKNSKYISVEIDENYPLSPEEAISKLTIWYRYVEVKQYVKPYKADLKEWKGINPLF